MATISREEVIAAEPVEAMARLLDIDPPAHDEVPELWHWIYLLPRPTSRDLGPDGHPATGTPAPPGPGMRRMFAGGRVETHRRLRIGKPATRTTWIANQTTKQGRSGLLRFVTVRHEISQAGVIAVTEEQDIVYRPPGNSPLTDVARGPQAALPTDRTESLALSVDERFLFRFSALTYNAHRLHYDRAWCRTEGYDHLVVHGPLQALMIGELARRNHISLIGGRFVYRLVSPMIGPQTMHVFAAAEGLTHGAEAYADDGHLTAVATIN